MQVAHSIERINVLVTTQNSPYRYYKIENDDELKKMLINNSVLHIKLIKVESKYRNINYMQLFELLKTNESVGSINFDNSYDNYDYNELYKLLYDVLLVNKNIGRFVLTKRVLTPDDCEHIEKILQVGINIKELILHCDITNVTFQFLINIINNNKIIDSIHIYAGSVVENGHKHIINALKYNFNITSIIFPLRIGHYYVKKHKYCNRNKHNIRLKSMMIQDL
jgi:hypothetical protein